MRVLQDKEVRMVGSSRPRKADVRIIAATNKDLAQLVRVGAFREDLYYRINVIPIHLPPLRDRDSDLMLLTNHFVSKYARELDREVPRFTDRALAVLQDHAWPGNVRELENLVRRLVVMTDGDSIDAPDLPSLMRFSVAGAGEDLRRTLAEVEANYVRTVLESVGGNKTQAAQILNIDRKTLRTKLQHTETDPTQGGTPRDGDPEARPVLARCPPAKRRFAEGEVHATRRTKRLMTASSAAMISRHAVAPNSPSSVPEVMELRKAVCRVGGLDEGIECQRRAELASFHRHVGFEAEAAGAHGPSASLPEPGHWAVAHTEVFAAGRSGNSTLMV